jgi:ubiquinone biosynthesis protein
VDVVFAVITSYNGWKYFILRYGNAMNIFRLNRNYKNLTRLIRIITIIAKYGFYAFLARIRAGLGIVPDRAFHTTQDAATKTLTEPERVRMAIEELGPAFIKLGQILSLRPDVIPPAYARELESLLDRTPPVPFPAIRQIIEDELSAGLEDIFEEIDETPVACGSIAQVHRAVLREGGDVVAVKVLKPGTRETVETDLSIVSYVVKLVQSYIPELEQYRPLYLVRELTEILHDELNFIREAHVMERFSRFFEKTDVSHIHIPKVYMGYTERSVLVMEYIDGIKISDVEALKQAGMDLVVIAENGARMGLKEIFEFGFFHADPHPGNLFVLPGNVIAPVDFGITGYIDEEAVQVIGNIFLGIIDRDVDRVIRYLRRYDFIGPDVDIRRLKAELYHVIDLIGDSRLEEIDVASTLQAVFNLIRKNHIQFPGEYFLILKTILQLDGLGKKLHPAFNVSKVATDIIRKWFYQRYRPKRSLKEIYYFFDDMQYYMKTMSTEMGTFIKSIGRNRMRIPLYHENLDRAVSELDRTGNRLSFAVIIAALLLASSILVQANIGPFIRGYPIVGLLGFLIAAVMGLWLLIGIIKSGKL